MEMENGSIFQVADKFMSILSLPPSAEFGQLCHDGSLDDFDARYIRLDIPSDLPSASTAAEGWGCLVLGKKIARCELLYMASAKRLGLGRGVMVMPYLA